VKIFPPEISLLTAEAIRGIFSMSIIDRGSMSNCPSLRTVTPVGTPFIGFYELELSTSSFPTQREVLYYFRDLL